MYAAGSSGALLHFDGTSWTEEERLTNQHLLDVSGTSASDYDSLTAFGDVVVASGPPQHATDTGVRTVGIYRVEDGTTTLVRSNEFATVPPYAGDPSVDTEASRSLVARFIDVVLSGHDLEALAVITSADILVHPTAMPCEAGFYGHDGAGRWLGASWEAFIVDQLVSAYRRRDPGCQAWFWRTATGDEVDLLVETGERLVPFEAKLHSTPTPDDARGLVRCMADQGLPRGYVVYPGRERYSLGRGVTALPAQRLLSPPLRLGSL